MMHARLFMATLPGHVHKMSMEIVPSVRAISSKSLVPLLGIAIHNELIRSYLR